MPPLITGPRMFETPVAGRVYTVNTARLIGAAGTTNIALTAGHTVVSMAGSAATTVGIDVGKNAQVSCTARAADIATSISEAETDNAAGGVATSNSSASGAIETPWLVPAGGITVSVVTTTTAIADAKPSAVLTVITYV